MTTEGDIKGILEQIDTWGAGHAAAAVIRPDGTVAAHGDPRHGYDWASVTKPVTALAVLIAADRGLLELDEAAGPPGATIRHLLAHSAGLAFEGNATLARPGTRRIYSNSGFDALGAVVAERAEMPFDRALDAWVFQPLGMTDAVLRGRPSAGIHGSLDDLVALARELLRPTLLPVETMATATSVAFPGLVGVVPGVGRFDPCDWGLGFELHDGKAPHWLGQRNSAATFGHFGGSGSFLWVDPVAEVTLAVMTDRPFGRWSLEAWPRLSDAVVATVLG